MLKEREKTVLSRRWFKYRQLSTVNRLLSRILQTTLEQRRKKQHDQKWMLHHDNVESSGGVGASFLVVGAQVAPVTTMIAENCGKTIEAEQHHRLALIAPEKKKFG